MAHSILSAGSYSCTQFLVGRLAGWGIFRQAAWMLHCFHNSWVLAASQFVWAGSLYETGGWRGSGPAEAAGGRRNACDHKRHAVILGATAVTKPTRGTLADCHPAARCRPKFALSAGTDSSTETSRTEACNRELAREPGIQYILPTTTVCCTVCCLSVCLMDHQEPPLVLAGGPRLGQEKTHHAGSRAVRYLEAENRTGNGSQ
jgi:hypothetical protein